MRYDEYLRLGYGIVSGAVESVNKQVVQARPRQAGMPWSESDARRLLALRLLLWNGDWALLDRMRMISLAEPHGRGSRLFSPAAVDLRTAMRHGRAMARRSTTEIPVDLRARLEGARLGLVTLFRARIGWICRWLQSPNA
jgi:hypothetical protein